MPRRPQKPPFSEMLLQQALAQANCWSDALRSLGYEPKGHNIRTVQRWARIWEISTDHFDPNAVRGRATASRATPLEAIMVENSTYSRGALKRRLLAAGVKNPICELCGQGDMWRGNRMSLVLDHINGVPTDHRLENLRMVCPNCAATLDTHCGRNSPRERVSWLPADVPPKEHRPPILLSGLLGSRSSGPLSRGSSSRAPESPAAAQEPAARGCRDDEHVRCRPEVWGL